MSFLLWMCRKCVFIVSIGVMKLILPNDAVTTGCIAFARNQCGIENIVDYLNVIMASFIYVNV